MSKTIVLIDGENFQFKLDELLTKKSGLELENIKISKLLKSIINTKLKLRVDKIVYYASKIKMFSDTKEKSKELISKQRKLKNKIEKEGIKFKFSGNVRAQKVTKDKFVFKEKGVDVAIAVDMVSLAVDKEYQNIILCSSDSDLQPAVKEVRNRNAKVIYLGFEHSPNKGLIYTTNNKILITAKDIVENNNGK